MGRVGVQHPPLALSRDAISVKGGAKSDVRYVVHQTPAVYVADVKSVVEGRQVLRPISWGRPAQEVQAVLDTRCPRCGVRKSDPDGYHFDIVKNGDGYLGVCFRCGWSL
jgi:hypothetical protein